MQLFRFLFRVSGAQLVLALFVSTASGIGSAYLVALINRALQATADQRAQIGVEFAVTTAFVLLGAWHSQSLFVRLSQATLARMRVHISELMLTAPYRHIEKQGSARLLAVLTSDVQTVSDFYVALPNLTTQGAIVLGCLAYLGTLSWQLFLGAVGITAFGIAGYQLTQARAFRHLQSARKHQDELFEHFRALCDGAKELRLHRKRRNEFFSDLLGESVKNVQQDQTRGFLLYVGSETFGNFIFFGFIGLVLFVLGSLMNLSNEVLSGYALVFLHLILPLDSLLQAVPKINRTRVALERIDHGTARLASALPDSSLRPEPTASSPNREPSIRLEGVTHRFYREQEDGSFLLGPIDLTLGGGEIVFVIGGNGSGKTTLAKLLAGLYRPESGRVLLNGEDVTEDNLDAYRENFSAVFSDFYLFERLIGLSEKHLDDKVAHWLKVLQLNRKVEVKDGRLSTTQLSQGQRKRLALLVAFLEDRPFYLFDEWAADQDPSYKQIFYTELLPALRARGKSIVVISHDDRYFDVADRCISLESGKLSSLSRQSGSPTPAREAEAS